MIQVSLVRACERKIETQVNQRKINERQQNGLGTEGRSVNGTILVNLLEEDVGKEYIDYQK